MPKKIILLAIITILFFSFSNVVLATDTTSEENTALDDAIEEAVRETDPLYKLEKSGEGAGYNVQLGIECATSGSETECAELASPQDIIFENIGKIIKYLLSFLGIIFFLIIIYAGWLWMTAGGNEEQITKAKDLLKNSFIGIIIIITAGVVSLGIFILISSAVS